MFNTDKKFLIFFANFKVLPFGEKMIMIGFIFSLNSILLCNQKLTIYEYFSQNIYLLMYLF
jgi:hypothetical protein